MKDAFHVARIFILGTLCFMLFLLLVQCGEQKQPEHHAPAPAPIEQRSAPVAPPIVVIPMQPQITPGAPAFVPAPVVVEPAPLPPKKPNKKPGKKPKRGKHPHLTKHPKVLPYTVTIPKSELIKRKAHKK